MPQSFKASLLATAAACLLCLPAVASATLVDGPPPLSPAAPMSGQPALAALDFLTLVLAQNSGGQALAAASDAVDAAASSAADEAQRAFRLDRDDERARPTHLRGDTDLFLFQLLGIFHSQRHGRHFELADRGVAFVITHHDQPSPVPLPGALWLFLMGLLGLAGTRLTGVGGTTATQDTRPPSLPMGAAVPA